MKDVGKEKMIEWLQRFAKSEKIDIETDKSEYLKLMDGTEILMCDDFKVLRTSESSMVSIHYDGSMVPVGMIKLSEGV